MRESPVRTEKIAVLRAAARPAGAGCSGDAMPSACAGAVAVGSMDTSGGCYGALMRLRSGGPRRAGRVGAATLRRRPMANIHSQKKRILRAERERLENRR